MPNPKPVAVVTLTAGALIALIVLGTATVRAGTVSASATNPVVIELYHSQGCSSCPPAEADLNALATRPDIIALSFAVTYWDRLGWKDTFGSPQYTQRQLDYAHAGQGEVATPEFIINGSHAVVGADHRGLYAALASIGAPGPGPIISVRSGLIHIEGPGGQTPAIVWLVRYDPRTLAVPIKAGENAGRTLPNRNVVRALIRLGDWNGRATAFALPTASEANLANAVLVQRGTGGPIVAAHKL